MAVLHPERAIWDLEHLADLSTAPNLFLIVSERTSYVLHNLAALDIWNRYRYALQPPENGIYLPLTDEESAEWALFREVAEDCQTQIVEVGTVPIETLLYASDESFSHVAAGTSVDLLQSIVPVGQVWVVTHWWTQISVASTGQFSLLLSGEQDTWLHRQLSLDTLINFGRINVYVKDNARMRFHYTGVTIGAMITGGYSFYALPVSAP